MKLLQIIFLQKILKYHILSSPLPALVRAFHSHENKQFIKKSIYFFQNFVISSKVLPLVSGTIFQTNIAESTDINP